MASTGPVAVGVIFKKFPIPHKLNVIIEILSLCLMMQLELSLLMLLEDLSFRASPFHCWMRLFLLFGQCLAQSSLVELSGESNLGAPAYTLTVVAAKTSKGMITKSDCFSALSHPLNQEDSLRSL